MSKPVPTELNLHRQSRVLEITFDDGAHFNLPCEYLRVFSPSALSSWCRSASVCREPR